MTSQVNARFRRAFAALSRHIQKQARAASAALGESSLKFLHDFPTCGAVGVAVVDVKKMTGNNAPKEDRIGGRVYRHRTSVSI